VRRASVLLLVVVAVFVACNRGAMPGVFKKTTPHESYAKALEDAGLGDTALVRDWKAAAEAALREAAAVTLPLDRSLRFTAAEARAFGYRLELQRGRTLRVQITYTGEAPATIFLDLFTPAATEGNTRFTRVASAERGQLVLEHEVSSAGPYVLRIQPELLRGGTLRIEQRSAASLRFPVSGRTTAAVRSFFGDERDGGRRDHHGVDIFAPRDTPVLAAANGIVTSVGTNRLGGNVVWVWDPARRQSQYYAHLSRQAVSLGSRVDAGEVIGYVGNTGNARSTTPHLHFGLYSFGEGPIDPLPYIAGAPAP
jgi:murein DD-endopeptidase MepM/ murein hydrolase activator NlpD